MSQTGRSSKLPKSQQLASSLAIDSEELVDEDKGNIDEASELDVNPPSQYVSKRRAKRTKEADGLIM